MKGDWKKRIKFIIVLGFVLGFLTVGAALYIGCGEETLPPPPPPNTGTITVTGAAV